MARAVEKLGFVQADPIRAPARAQDLTLRLRVRDYHAGDLERRYPRLDLDEGFFVNHGFMRRADYRLMLPRPVPHHWDRLTRRRARAMLEFVRGRGTAHPREVLEQFAHGTTTNYWGGSSNATTHLLNEMQYGGLLRVVRRDAGIRVYAVQEPAAPARDVATRRARLDALIDIIVRTYAPLPAASLAWLGGRLHYATPQWSGEVRAALQRARQRLAHASLDGMDWYWPAHERPNSRRYEVSDRACLLSPFDPIVWDRRRFERFWGWAYRFEAYTPAAKRQRGYYALPLLWRDAVIGWANLISRNGQLTCDLGFVTARPRDTAFDIALEEELARMQSFLPP
jgi:uncharacterized protein YcaQ